MVRCSAVAAHAPHRIPIGTRKECDLLVVGAGPAGCSAAVFAARQGLRVVLADKARFPRDKVCGDAITPAAQSVLARLGLLGPIERANPWRAQRILIHSPSGMVADAAASSAEGGASPTLVMPRKVFDGLLVAHAMATARIEVLEATEIARLSYENGTVCGGEGRHAGEAVVVRARWVIAADGAHSKIARELSLFNRAPEHHGLGIRAYFENVDGLEDAIEFHYFAESKLAYAWIFPVGARSANLGLGILRKGYSTKDIKQRFENLMADPLIASRRLRNATMVEKSLRAWPLPLATFPSERGRANVLLAGDAGSFADPRLGEGISYALRSGELAAQAVAEAAVQVSAQVSPATIYERLWRREFSSWNEAAPACHIPHPRRAADCPPTTPAEGAAVRAVHPKVRLLRNL